MQQRRTLGFFRKCATAACKGLVLILLISAWGCSDSDNNDTGMRPVTTTRDDKGVWFISGGGPIEDVFEAQGYAVATDRLWQAELYRRTGRGRLAEILGPDQLPTDVFMRTTGYSYAELQRGFNALSAEEQAIIQAYVDGFNRRIAEVRENPELLPFEFKALGISPEDWSFMDVLAWMTTMLRNFDPEGNPKTNIEQIKNAGLVQYLTTVFGQAQGMLMFNDLRWPSDPSAITYIPPATAASTSAAGDENGAARFLSAEADTETDAISKQMPDLSAVAEKLAEQGNTIIENLKKINAYVKMGSYAWTVSGAKTASGNPTIYSGPQMGFSVPSITLEGSIDTDVMKVSGMTVPGIPGIIIGRTPHHAWAMMVGHNRSTDFYIEDPANVTLDRLEIIKVKGQADVTLPVWRTAHGPVINPLPYDPNNYTASPENPIIAWKYAYRGYEFQTVGAFFKLARVQSIDEFGEALKDVAVSQHFLYADRDGNIAYWMSGRNPVRPAGEYRFPQGAIPGIPVAEWDAAVVNPLPHDRNTAQGFYTGWNNKSYPEAGNSPNNPSYQFGPFHRAHVLSEYFSTHDNLTFEELRDHALDNATTDSFGLGGNPWAFVSASFNAAVQADATAERLAALEILSQWDGHFVDGGPDSWAEGPDRADGWVLMDAWIREALRMTFADELGDERYSGESKQVLFNVMLHALTDPASGGIVTGYDWFTNLVAPEAPQTFDDIVTASLDSVLAALGDRPWGVGERGEITYDHDMLGTVHVMPFSSRSTYAHCVEMGPDGPVRIESMFPLGESGTILMNADGSPNFDPNFFSMTPVFDTFVYRPFPVFE